MSRKSYSKRVKTKSKSKSKYKSKSKSKSKSKKDTEAFQQMTLIYLMNILAIFTYYVMMKK